MIISGLTPGQQEVLNGAVGSYGLGYFIGICFVVAIVLFMRGR